MHASCCDLWLCTTEDKVWCIYSIANPFRKIFMTTEVIWLIFLELVSWKCWKMVTRFDAYHVYEHTFLIPNMVQRLLIIKWARVVVSVGKHLNFYELCVDNCGFSVVYLKIIVILHGFLRRMCLWHLINLESKVTRYM